MLLFTPYGLAFSIIMALPPLVYIVLALIARATSRGGSVTPSPDAAQAAVRLSSSALNPTCVAALGDLRASDELDADKIAGLATGSLVHAWQTGAIELSPAWAAPQPNVQATGTVAQAGTVAQPGTWPAGAQASAQAGAGGTLDFDATRLTIRHEPTDPVDATARDYLMPPYPANPSLADVYKHVVLTGEQHGQGAQAFSAAVREACVAQGLAEKPTALQRLLSSKLEFAIRIWAIVGIIATLLMGIIVFVLFMLSAVLVLSIRQNLTAMGEAAQADLAAVLAHPEEAARAVSTPAQLAWLVEAATGAQGAAGWRTVTALCRAADPAIARELGGWCADSVSPQFAEPASFVANLSIYFSSARVEADRD